MFKRTIFIAIYFISVSIYARAEITGIEAIQKNDHILIFAPHPDDETIACAGIIQQAKNIGARVRVVYLTNGEHNEFAFIVYKKRFILTKPEFVQMGEMRKEEAVRAMKLLGLHENELVFLGYPDYGTFGVFTDYWRAQKPFKDFLTRISNVPYKKSLSYGAAYKAESILSDLERVISLYRPNKIFVSHPADVNVDHKALYLFLEVALADLSWELPRPKIYPYLIHVAGWPSPRHYRPELELVPPEQFAGFPLEWRQYQLSPEQLEKKHRAVLFYPSQTASSAFYLLAFVRKNELFSDYPALKLAMPQQDGAKEKNKLLLLKEHVTSFLDLTNTKFEEKGAVSAETLDSPDGNNRISYAILGNSLLVRIRKAKESSNRRIISSVYIFGYSYDKDFAVMPKIHITTKYNTFKVYDGKKQINPEGMALDLSQKNLILKVPLKALGEPDFILTSVRAYTGALPEDFLGFCKINLVEAK